MTWPEKGSRTPPQAKTAQTAHHPRNGPSLRMVGRRRCSTTWAFDLLRHPVRIPDEALDRPPAPRIRPACPPVRFAGHGSRQPSRNATGTSSAPSSSRNPTTSTPSSNSGRPPPTKRSSGRSTRRSNANSREGDRDGRQLETLNASYLDLQQRIDTVGRGCDNIPSIQPVINKQLTLLTASYGMRIHPFFKTLQAHQGVDYTIPEGSRVFATADGVVRDASRAVRPRAAPSSSTTETGTKPLQPPLEINVRKGPAGPPRRHHRPLGRHGPFASPHLHYEVRKDGMRVDPVHYFFMELTPGEYQRLMRIAQAGMQSLRLRQPRHGDNRKYKPKMEI